MDISLDYVLNEMSIIMFDLNVFWIKCPFNITINSGFGIKCLVYKKVSLMSNVMYHTKSDIKGFVCIFVIVDMIVLQNYYLFFLWYSTIRCFIVLIVIFMNYSGLWFNYFMNKTVWFMHDMKSVIRGLVCLFVIVR